mmetsp:Transcript_15704/g.66155  ORF Transcript_15704/g.66155 Transcript_15704/m.66155 type:complete len:226 (-) Transcript_15704:234-911(-)
MFPYAYTTLNETFRKKSLRHRNVGTTPKSSSLNPAGMSSKKVSRKSASAAAPPLTKSATNELNSSSGRGACAAPLPPELDGPAREGTSASSDSLNSFCCNAEAFRFPLDVLGAAFAGAGAFACASCSTVNARGGTSSVCFEPCVCFAPTLSSARPTPEKRKRLCFATNSLALWMDVSHPRHRNARSSWHTTTTGAAWQMSHMGLALALNATRSCLATTALAEWML